MGQLANVTGVPHSTQNFQINYNVLVTMYSSIQYGGRITDNLDRELFDAYCLSYFKESILTNEFNFAKVQLEGTEGKDSMFAYKIPNGVEHKVFTDYIDKLPPVDLPEIFGLHNNADLTYRLKETGEMILTLLETRPKDSGDSGGKSRDEQVQDKCRDLQHSLTYEYPAIEVKELLAKMPGP